MERQLGIPRRLRNTNGYETARLWWLKFNNHDKTALPTLLKCDKENVINLKTMKEMLLTARFS
jgi:uncharacterized protein YprB with RNaseH-like and TPR domain